MIVSPAPPKGEITYPESDGKPLAESPIHIEALIALRFALRTFFRERADVYIGANMFLYFVEGDLTEVVAPDVFVALGVPNRARRTYKVWEEGQVPAVIFEITSESTRREDVRSKRSLYEELGVHEYFLFDPLGEYLKPALKKYQLREGSYVSVDGENLASQMLGLEFRVDGEHLRVHDPARGIDLLYPDEEETARQVAEERALLETLRAEREAERAEREAAARQAAEAEVARLRAEIEKLRGAQP
ncbi:MAG: Uma2 family endonuclease [Chloroflexi bacterium]|nr:Uma2 family endonuclease [Chloroflexota bacterium]